MGLILTDEERSEGDEHDCKTVKIMYSDLQSRKEDWIRGRSEEEGLAS